MTPSLPPRFRILLASTSIRQSMRWCCRSMRRAKSRHPAGAADEARPLRHDTHDYKRHGTTTLFAALNVLDGKVIGQCMSRHRHQEFIRFLNQINRETPAERAVHLI